MLNKTIKIFVKTRDFLGTKRALKLFIILYCLEIFFLKNLTPILLWIVNQFYGGYLVLCFNTNYMKAKYLYTKNKHTFKRLSFPNENSKLSLLQHLCNRQLIEEFLSSSNINFIILIFSTLFYYLNNLQCKLLRYLNYSFEPFLKKCNSNSSKTLYNPITHLSCINLRYLTK